MSGVHCFYILLTCSLQDHGKTRDGARFQWLGEYVNTRLTTSSRSQMKVISALTLLDSADNSGWLRALCPKVSPRNRALEKFRKLQVAESFREIELDIVY